MGAPLGNNNADGPHKKHHGGRKKGSHIVHHKAHGNKTHKGHKGHHGGHHSHHAQQSQTEQKQ